MRRQAATWLKPRSKKKFILEILSICMILFIAGGILFQVNPLFRQHVLCPFCATTNSPADPNIYVISHTPLPTTTSNYASNTFLYTIDAQTGKTKHTIDLNKIGGIYFQKVMNGISYEVVSNGIGSPIGTNAIVLATRLNNGDTLWSDLLVPGSVNYAVATTTMLYLNLVYSQTSGNNAEGELLAINLKNGMQSWQYTLQSDGALVILHDNTLLVQETGDNIVALRPDNGKTLWSYGFNDSNGYIIAPVADGGHAFFGYVTAQQPSKVFEYNENTGSLLWQKTLNAADSLASLQIENHYLLIETTTHKLYVVRDSDKSVIWSYTFQPSYALQNQQQNDRWIYTGDIVYGLSSEIDPQTFATNRVMRAWQISNGKKLFQINLDLAGEFAVDRIQDQLLFTSTNNNNSSSRMYNDVEARQAQTGTLLWHKHVGQLPAKSSGYEWNLSVVNPAGLQSDGLGYTIYYLPDNREQNPSILYVTMYRYDTDAHMLYALNMQNGNILWQVNPDALNSNPKLHAITQTPVPTPTSITSSVPTPNGNPRCPLPSPGSPEGIAKISEFPVPTSGSSPEGIAAGPDGNLWFTEFDGNRIGRITPGGMITQFPIPTSHYYPFPEGIAAGPDGNLWFTESQTNQIGRISPGGKITQFPIPTSDGGLEGITTGPDGNLWFTESAGNGQIGRITPGGKITQFPVPGAGSMPFEITAGPDGNLWFTDDFSEIGRITPGGKITEFPVPTSGSTPQEITSGPDGNLWFTMSGGQTEEIGRMTPEGKVTQFSVPISGCSPLGITAGPDGNLWFTENIGNQIGRITPNGTITQFPIPTTGSGPKGIASGRDGNIWFTENTSNQIGYIVVGK